MGITTLPEQPREVIGLTFNIKLPNLWYSVWHHMYILIVHRHFFCQPVMGDHYHIGVNDLLNLFSCKAYLLVVFIQYMMLVKLPIIIQINTYLKLIPVL